MCSFSMVFNYNILNYLRLNYLRLMYTQFWHHFLTAILFFLVLGCIIIVIIIVIITSSNDIQPSTVISDQWLCDHYVDIEKITGFRAGPVDCINRVFDCYIRVYQSFSTFISKVQLRPTHGYAPEMRHLTNLQDFKSLLMWSCLSIGIQYTILIDRNYYRFFTLQLIIHFHSQSKPLWSCYWPKII